MIYTPSTYAYSLVAVHLWWHQMSNLQSAKKVLLSCLNTSVAQGPFKTNADAMLEKQFALVVLIK